MENKYIIYMTLFVKKGNPLVNFVATYPNPHLQIAENYHFYDKIILEPVEVDQDGKKVG